MNKYHLVILGVEWDVYRVAYQDLIDNPRITYISTFRPRGIKGLFQRMHLNPFVNRLMHLPGKHLWNATIFKDVERGKVCFFGMERWLRHESGMKVLSYLRTHFHDAKIVCFTQDLIETIIDKYTHRVLDVDYVKRYADLFISYDKNDAERYGLYYHPTVYSPITIAPPPDEPVVDLFFLGRDKGRLPLLIEIAREAARRGVTCRFLLIGVPKKQRLLCEGIYYLDGELSYDENIEACAHARCLLEAIQPHAGSATFRTWETIMLNRKLLTNNIQIKDSDVYDGRYVSVFSDVTDIDWNFITTPLAFPDGCNPFQEQIRPESLVRFIEKQIGITIDR